MIHILFVPGSFGSTINLIIQNFCENITPDKNISLRECLLDDGSAHGYFKRGHWACLDDYNHFFDGRIDQNLLVSTPVYPIVGIDLSELFSMFVKHRPMDKVIFVYINDMYYGEINLLAQHYKIAVGSSLGSDIWHFDEVNLPRIKQWNPNYKSHKDMKVWELREFISMMYRSFIEEWIEAPDLTPTRWLKIRSDRILNDTENVLIDICNFVDRFDYSKLAELKEFIITWKQKQQYLINEVNLVNEIVNAVVNQRRIFWDPTKLCIWSEAMIQKKLRDNGYELKCSGLDTFPTDSVKLRLLLEKL